ncbi:hypothetical protein K466DRAFT_438418, partial [Polyporus arcularius HHB13444]
AMVRCRECTQLAPVCEDCMVSSHRNQPFHWVDKWNGSYFERKGLADLGLVMNLGHDGEPCPNLPTGAPKPIDVVIVHMNGVHQGKLQECHCVNRPSLVTQLMRADIFPASLHRIETAFTHEVLKAYDLLFNLAKVSTLDFVRWLARRTDNSAPQEVKDRYRDFLWAARIHKYLTMVKRSGRVHAIVLPGRDPDDITVPCLTCPWPDVNLPADWEDAPPHLRYLYRIIFHCDGNHSLNKRSKQDDIKDVPLTNGQGQFVRNGKMQAYLDARYNAKKQQGDGTDEVPGETCAGFKVIRSQRPGKFKYMDVSGVVAVICNHQFSLFGAVADLQTAETWGHGDFALAGALR